jgi:hypothetical protein
LVHRLDMSDENCLKIWYSTDFGIGPIEYKYVWHMDKFWKTKHIYMAWSH